MSILNIPTNTASIIHQATSSSGSSGDGSVDLTGINNNIFALQNDISTINTKNLQQDGTVNTLSGRVDTNEQSITNIETKNSEQDTALLGIQDDIQSINNKNLQQDEKTNSLSDELNTKINDNTSNINTNSSLITDSTEEISSLSAQITTNSTNISLNTNRLDVVETTNQGFAKLDDPLQEIKCNSVTLVDTEGVETNLLTKMNDTQNELDLTNELVNNLEQQITTESTTQAINNQLSSINNTLQSLGLEPDGQNLINSANEQAVLNTKLSENEVIVGNCNQDGLPARLILHGECNLDGINFDGTTDSELWFTRGYNIPEPHEWKDSTYQQSYFFGHTIEGSQQRFELNEKLSNRSDGDDNGETKKLMSFNTDESVGFNKRLSIYTDNISLAGKKIFLGTSVQSLQDRLSAIEEALGFPAYRPTTSDPESEFTLIPPYVGWTANNVTFNGVTYESGGTVNNWSAFYAFSTANSPYVGSGDYNKTFGSYIGNSASINGYDGDWFWLKVNKKIQVGSIMVGENSNFRSWRVWKETPTTVVNGRIVTNADLLLSVDFSGGNAQKGCGYYPMKLRTVEANERLYIQVNTIIAGEDPSSLIAKDIFFEGKFLD